MFLSKRPLLKLLPILVLAAISVSLFYPFQAKAEICFDIFGKNWCPRTLNALTNVTGFQQLWDNLKNPLGAIVTSLSNFLLSIIGAVMLIAVGIFFLIGLILGILIQLLSLLTGTLLSVFIGILFAFSIKDIAGGGWEATRNIANLFIIFGLLLAAVELIRKQELGAVQSQIIKIAIAALIINFTLFGLGAMYDLSNMVLASILPNDMSKLSFNPVNVDPANFFQQFFDKMGDGFQKIQTAAASNNPPLSVLSNTIAKTSVTLISPTLLLYLWVFNSFLELVFQFYLAYILVYRFVITIITIVFMPLALAGELIPFAGLGGLKSSLWKKFQDWMLKPIIVFIIVILGSIIVSGLINTTPASPVSQYCLPSNTAVCIDTQGIQLLMRFVLAFAIYVAVFALAKKTGEGLEKSQGWATGLIGRVGSIGAGVGVGVAGGLGLTSLSSRALQGTGKALLQSSAAGKLRLHGVAKRWVDAGQGIESERDKRRETEIKGLMDAGLGADAILARGGTEHDYAVALELLKKEKRMGDFYKIMARAPDNRIDKALEILKDKDVFDRAEHPFSATNALQFSSLAQGMKPDDIKGFAEVYSDTKLRGRLVKKFGGDDSIIGSDTGINALATAVMANENTARRNAPLITGFKPLRQQVLTMAETAGAANPGTDQQKAASFVDWMNTNGLRHQAFDALGFRGALPNLSYLVTQIGTAGGPANYAAFVDKAREQFDAKL